MKYIVKVCGEGTTLYHQSENYCGPSKDLALKVSLKEARKLLLLSRVKYSHHFNTYPYKIVPYE